MSGFALPSLLNYCFTKPPQDLVTVDSIFSILSSFRRILDLCADMMSS